MPTGPKRCTKLWNYVHSKIDLAIRSRILLYNATAQLLAERSVVQDSDYHKHSNIVWHSLSCCALQCIIVQLIFSRASYLDSAKTNGPFFQKSLKSSWLSTLSITCKEPWGHMHETSWIFEQMLPHHFACFLRAPCFSSTARIELLYRKHYLLLSHCLWNKLQWTLF